MFIENKTTVLKREILTRIAALCFEDKLVQEINRLPVQMIKKEDAPYRCCIYKDRAIIKFRAIALLGFSLENDKEIDYQLLSDYAHLALQRTKTTFPILTFIDEACRSCVRANYVVTNVCQNCVARPCTVNCPKKIISIRNHQAYIDPEKCINCGKCMQVCPYHAIVYVPVPCEEACPAGAISKNELGKQTINYDKCIFCGKCTMACPFGAVMEKSWITDVIKHLKGEKAVTAMLAPSIVGQFGSSIQHIAGALKALGFSHVVEVALGADETIAVESAELRERLEQGVKKMGTSCCPAYLEAVKKHARAFLPFVSHALTPMAYTAKLAGKKFPGAIRVFIGPCVAKKHEDLANEDVDYVLTFEELAALLAAKGITAPQAAPVSLDLGQASGAGRGFPVSNGVAAAIKKALGDKTTVATVLINGLTRTGIKTLEQYAHECPAQLVEIMSCEGGCMSGPGVIEKPVKGVQRLTEFLKQTPGKET